MHVPILFPTVYYHTVIIVKYCNIACALNFFVFFFPEQSSDNDTVASPDIDTLMDSYDSYSDVESNTWSTAIPWSPFVYTLIKIQIIYGTNCIVYFLFTDRSHSPALSQSSITGCIPTTPELPWWSCGEPMPSLSPSIEIVDPPTPDSPTSTIIISSDSSDDDDRSGSASTLMARLRRFRRRLQFTPDRSPPASPLHSISSENAILYNDHSD